MVMAGSAISVVPSLSLLLGIVAMAVGVLVVVVGLAGRHGMRRNRFAGIRTVTSMRSDSAFAAANRAGAGPIIVGGMLSLLAGLVAVLLGGVAGIVSGFAGILMVLVFAVAGAVVGNRAARRADPYLGG
jgi:hypothetical protein